ncbi:hypothetical protein M406DRAFT_354815 [Cryphonectria parasitica EP155]|uniref:Uncharacterized protein n=1 Tax=Cryphonectria parasitica (strain ATCC 38755 / EP155) TaxID=660469 RepID=A0A9P4YD61_CRYP1|nr:uncharacterized protein M406DRAFT_354815 [Cryphonectria parasitica EP155]KAF3771322.1 hypothetical protein M406DRAFT_354815 [Cryphonectria parasitica EP155]
MLEGTLYASTAMNTPSTRDIMDRLSALEAQGPRFVKTTFDAPQTPKSPSPSHDATIQRNMENMVNKKIQSLPTMASVTEKVIQIETSFREMFTPYQRDTNARLDTAEKEIDASKVRIKELNKQLNKNTNELDKWSASIKGLEGAVTKLINRPNTASGGQVAPCPNNDELASLKQAIKEEEKKREAAAAKTALLMNHVNKIDTEVGELLRHLQPDGL